MKSLFNNPSSEKKIEQPHNDDQANKMALFNDKMALFNDAVQSGDSNTITHFVENSQYIHHYFYQNSQKIIAQLLNHNHNECVFILFEKFPILDQLHHIHQNQNFHHKNPKAHWLAQLTHYAMHVGDANTFIWIVENYQNKPHLPLSKLQNILASLAKLGHSKCIIQLCEKFPKLDPLALYENRYNLMEIAAMEGQVDCIIDLSNHFKEFNQLEGNSPSKTVLHTVAKLASFKDILRYIIKTEKTQASNHLKIKFFESVYSIIKQRFKNDQEKINVFFQICRAPLTVIAKESIFLDIYTILLKLFNNPEKINTLEYTPKHLQYLKWGLTNEQDHTLIEHYCKLGKIKSAISLLEKAYESELNALSINVDRKDPKIIANFTLVMNYLNRDKDLSYLLPKTDRLNKAIVSGNHQEIIQILESDSDLKSFWLKPEEPYLLFTLATLDQPQCIVELSKHYNCINPMKKLISTGKSCVEHILTSKNLSFSRATLWMKTIKLSLEEFRDIAYQTSQNQIVNKRLTLFQEVHKHLEKFFNNPFEIDQNIPAQLVKNLDFFSWNIVDKNNLTAEQAFNIVTAHTVSLHEALSLIFAIGSSDSKLLARLLDNNKELFSYQIDLKQNTFLHLLASCDKHSCIKELSKHISDFETKVPRNINKSTPLHSAAYHGNIQTVFTLLNCTNINPENTDVYDRTFLYYAIYNCDPKLVSILIVDYNIKLPKNDFKNNSILHVAAQTGHFELSEKIRTHYNLNPFQLNASGLMPIDMACLYNCTDFIYKFIEKHISKPNTQNSFLPRIFSLLIRQLQFQTIYNIIDKNKHSISIYLNQLKDSLHEAAKFGGFEFIVKGLSEYNLLKPVTLNLDITNIFKILLVGSKLSDSNFQYLMENVKLTIDQMAQLAKIETASNESIKYLSIIKSRNDLIHTLLNTNTKTIINAFTTEDLCVLTWNITNNQGVSLWKILNKIHGEDFIGTLKNKVYPIEKTPTRSQKQTLLNLHQNSSYTNSNINEGIEKTITSTETNCNIKNKELNSDRIKIKAGIDPKYLEKASFRSFSPIRKKSQRKYSYRLNFKRLIDQQPGSSKKRFKTSFQIGNSRLDFHSKNKRGIDPNKDQVTFVFAGRVKNALLPPVSSQQRVILVLTPDEFFSIKKKLKNYDALVIQSLKSDSHGEYKNIKLITPRRIAALMFAHYIRLNYAIFMDDNISAVLYNWSQNLKSNAIQHWENISQTLIENLKDKISTSIPTKGSKETPNKLGSKIFIKNIYELRKKFPNPSDMFLFFAPAKSSDWWGSDYYFQLMMHFSFSKSNLAGFGIAPSKTICLIRSEFNRGACKKTLKKANIHIRENLLSNIDRSKVDTEHYQFIQKTNKEIQRIVKENIEYQRTRLEDTKYCNLIKEHANYNGIQCTDTLLQPKFISALDNLTPRELLSLAINKNLDKLDFLYPHQNKILKAIQAQPELSSRVLSATGTGKTMIQFALALMLYNLGLNKPIAIVTPYKTLIQQTYIDFLAYIKKFKGKLPFDIPGKNIVKVSSNDLDISYNHILLNNSIGNQNAILIFCANSFQKFSAQLNQKNYFSLVLLDEYHVTPKPQLDVILKTHAQSPLLGLSATPPLERVFEHESFCYSRQDALKDRRVTPIIIHQVEDEYSKDSLNTMIQNLPIHLEDLHPNGQPFSKLKGIIYLPNIKYCQKTASIIKKHNIPVFIIHSKNQDHKEDLKKYFSLPVKSPAILLAVNMLNIGFNDNRLKFAFIYKNTTNPNRTLQMAGRISRIDPNQDNKIAYIETFKNANLSGFKVTCDPLAQRLQSKLYNASMLVDYLEGSFINQIRKQHFTSTLLENISQAQKKRHQMLSKHLKNCKSYIQAFTETFERMATSKIKYFLNDPFYRLLKQLSSIMNQVTKTLSLGQRLRSYDFIEKITRTIELYLEKCQHTAQANGYTFIDTLLTSQRVSPSIRSKVIELETIFVNEFIQGKNKEASPLERLLLIHQLEAMNIINKVQKEFISLKSTIEYFWKNIETQSKVCTHIRKKPLYILMVELNYLIKNHQCYLDQDDYFLALNELKGIFHLVNLLSRSGIQQAIKSLHIHEYDNSSHHYPILRNTMGLDNIPRDEIIVPGDGNCCYHAVLLGAHHAGIQVPFGVNTLSEFRYAIAEKIHSLVKENIIPGEPLNIHLNEYTSLYGYSFNTLKGYLKHVKSPNTFGDQLELIAMAHMLKADIIIHNEDYTQPYTISGSNKEDAPVIHLHRIKEHFNLYVDRDSWNSSNVLNSEFTNTHQMIKNTPNTLFFTKDNYHRLNQALIKIENTFISGLGVLLLKQFDLAHTPNHPLKSNEKTSKIIEDIQTSCDQYIHLYTQIKSFKPMSLQRKEFYVLMKDIGKITQFRHKHCMAFTDQNSLALQACQIIQRIKRHLSLLNTQQKDPLNRAISVKP